LVLDRACVTLLTPLEAPGPDQISTH
jgi:hypothetical protein